MFRKQGHEFLAHRYDRKLLFGSFWDHELVQQYGGANVIPLRLFLDYARIDAPSGCRRYHRASGGASGGGGQ
eukprot:9347804-Pyramimonas_sp.AAC.1